MWINATDVMFDKKSENVLTLYGLVLLSVHTEIDKYSHLSIRYLSYLAKECCQ